MQDALDRVSRGASDDYSRRASGVDALMDKFSSCYGLQLAHMIFSALENLSRSIQTENIHVEDISKAVETTIAFYERKRTEEEFTTFYSRVTKEAEELTDPPCLPRYRKRSKRLDDVSLPHSFDLPEDLHRQQYYEALERVTNELKRRFEQKTMKTVQNIEQLIIDAASANDFDINTVTELYSDDLSIADLTKQLPMLPDLLKVEMGDNYNKDGIKINMVSKAILSSKAITVLFSEVEKLLRLYMTIPVTSATAERTFSALKRIKTYTRAHMTQKRLNNCLILHAHTDMTDNLNLLQIAKDFINRNEHRWAYFGSFH